jgi:hypothetical protein
VDSNTWKWQTVRLALAMRFIANGPIIPDELLIARDRGEVVFFCGAGVSQARAGLANFVQLAKKAIDALGASQNSPSRRLLDVALKAKPIESVGGFVATDRLFSLLEREFDSSDIHNAVTNVLRTADNVDLTAHRTILDLAGLGSNLQLITTNFDLLFEKACPDVQSVGPLDLPDLRRTNLRGIVHLHGKVSTDYLGPDEGGFVLSSADFGRAYLADGWATQFIRSLLSKYSIVFLGYSAEDPPVQYLLEALKVSAPPDARRMYAFQSGESAEATALWEHKGVDAIAFNPSGNYAALWDTLEAWAERARDVDGWYDGVLAAAAAGPSALEPHTRGQLAHIASTEEGVRRILGAEIPLSASWLHVFDARERYRGPSSSFEEEGVPPQDPFDDLSIDVDVPPQQQEEGMLHRDRDPPEGAWDAFHLSSSDAREPRNANTGVFRTTSGWKHVDLPARLSLLASWIARISHEPETLLWAVRQPGFHPSVRSKISQSLDFHRPNYPEHVASAWMWLLRSLSDVRDDPDQIAFAIEREAGLSGWSDELVRKLAKSCAPQLEVERYLPFIPGEDKPQLVTLDVRYPAPHTLPRVPDELLGYQVRQFCANLELAKSLEAEVRGNDYVYLTSTWENGGTEPVDLYGLAGAVVIVQRLVDRLIAFDRPAARAEFQRWPRNDDGVFARLRIWAAGHPRLLSQADATKVLLELSDRVFWGYQGQRDLLFAIRDRWADFSPTSRSQIEKRLMTTSYPWPDKKDARQDDARSLTARVKWFVHQGMRMSPEVEAHVASIAPMIGEMPQDVEDLIESDRPQVFSIDTDDDPQDLLGLPIAEILEHATGTTDFARRTQREPFQGLAKQRPLRALSALLSGLKRGDASPSHWADFLRQDKRTTDSTRMIRLIAGGLIRAGGDQIRPILYPVADWMKRLASRLTVELPSVFDALWSACVLAADGSPVRKRRRRSDSERSWADDALNSPVGRLADLLFSDPAIIGLERNRGLPIQWTSKMESLLSLPGDLRRQALVMASHRVVFLYNIDPRWTTAHLLSVHAGEDDDADAFWNGFFWRNRFPSRTLFRRMKRSMLALSQRAHGRRSDRNSLAGMLVFAWLDGRSRARQLVEDAELREAIVGGGPDFGESAIWQLKELAKPLKNRKEIALHFFGKCWPLQKAFKSARMSTVLANYAIRSPDLFCDLFPTIKPRLVRSVGFDSFPLTHGGGSSLVEACPGQVLDLLDTILPLDPTRWPHDLHKLLDALHENAIVASDIRLTALRRRAGGRLQER